MRRPMRILAACLLCLDLSAAVGGARALPQDLEVQRAARCAACQLQDNMGGYNQGAIDCDTPGGHCAPSV
jgi:hypothetical protein